MCHGIIRLRPERNRFIARALRLAGGNDNSSSGEAWEGVWQNSTTAGLEFEDGVSEMNNAADHFMIYPRDRRGNCRLMSLSIKCARYAGAAIGGPPSSLMSA